MHRPIASATVCHARLAAVLATKTTEDYARECELMGLLLMKTSEDYERECVPGLCPAYRDGVPELCACLKSEEAAERRFLRTARIVSYAGLALALLIIGAMCFMA